MKAGFAERDITPKPGMEKPGGYSKAFHKEGDVHDPLKARAAVFDDGTIRVALVGIDAPFIERPLVMAARQAIHARCGIAPEAVLVGASHTHSGGPMGLVQPGQYDHASDLVKNLAYERSSMADPRYLDMVRDAIVEAVVAADAARVDALASVGSGRETQSAFNRRLRMKNGLTYTHAGKCNPDILDFAGPADPEVGVIGAWADGRLLGCVVNFACHGTTGPGGTSTDWIYTLEQTIRGVMGDQAVVVFLNGASGDVTQVNNRSPYLTDYGERSARLVGTRVGAEALKVLVSTEPGDLTPIVAKSTLLRIPRRTPSPDRVTRALELVQQDPEAVGTTEWIFAKETVLLDARLRTEPVADVEVQAIQIGPAVFLANPAEVFAQLGLDIKAASHFPYTWIAEIANGCVCYVPTEEAFGPHGGGYETRLTSYSNLEVAAGRKIVDASVALARSLTPGPVPEPPKAPPFDTTHPRPPVPPELD